MTEKVGENLPKTFPVRARSFGEKFLDAFWSNLDRKGWGKFAQNVSCPKFVNLRTCTNLSVVFKLNSTASKLYLQFQYSGNATLEIFQKCCCSRNDRLSAKKILLYPQNVSAKSTV